MMNQKNYYIGMIKDGEAHVTKIPLSLKSTSFIADPIGAAHFPLKKLDVSSYEGKAVIISDNGGYHARVIETLGEKVTKELKEILSEEED